MSASWAFAAMVAGAYMVGAIPWGAIVARLAGGVDLRRRGSGSTGTTNVMRTVGVGPAIVVLAFDLGKGALVVAAAGPISGAVGVGGDSLPTLEAACALAALVGHAWPVYLRFRGGKGIATGLGALLVLSPWLGVGALALSLPIMAVTRYVSLGSVIGAAAGGFGLAALAVAGVHPAAYGIYGAVGATLILFRHRANLRRLLSGTEARVGQPARAPGPGSPQRGTG